MAAVPTEAPDFTLDHVLGHEVSLSDYRGQNVVVMFGGRDSGDQVKQSAKAIRGRYGPDELPILGVSDLGAVPRPARIIAKTQIKKAFEEAVNDATETLQAQGKEAPADKAKLVVMLMDWKGEVASSFGMSGVDKQAAGVLVDGEGRVLGSGAGAQAGEELLAQVPSQ